MRTNGSHTPLASDGLLEDEAARRHPEAQQILTRSTQRFFIDERWSKLVLVPMNTSGSLVRVRGKEPIPPL